MNMMDDMVIRPYSRNTVVWEDKTKETMLKVYTGELTLEEACEQNAKDVNEELAAEKN